MLMEIQNVEKHFEIKKGFFKRPQWIHAVNGVTLSIKPDEIVGLVGESGCGKSTLGFVSLGIYAPTSGHVHFLGEDVHALKGKVLKEFKRKAQIVFQDPYAALNPRRNVFDTVAQPFLVHKTTQKERIRDEVKRILDEVGLSPPEMFSDRYPHELSGGQRQRVCIARAIALNPAFLVADEPVSSLDMSVRAQILNIFKKLRHEYKMSILFITHELAVVRSLVNRVAVMYLGQIVEKADVAELFENPCHPYTDGLFRATPIPNPRRARSRQLKILGGEPPSPKSLPKGCHFHPRCDQAMPKCKREAPLFFDIKKDHKVRCWLYK